LGQGAEFVLQLPLKQAEVAVPPTAPAEPAPSNRRRVLIIEDNVDAAVSLRDRLLLGGHAVDVAYTGHDGLRKARALRPEIVLCDIGLPGIDGYEVARAFRADTDLRPALLVALTGYALPDDLAKARAAGFDEHLAKPADPEKLERILTRRSAE